jgi:hypothetical protein
MNALKAIVVAAFIYVPISTVWASDPPPPKAVEEPRLQRYVEPQLPVGFKQTDIVGKVVAEFEVVRNGTVKKLRIISSDDQRLSEIVTAAVSQWVYDPSTLPADNQFLKIQLTFIFKGKPSEKVEH